MGRREEDGEKGRKSFKQVSPCTNPQCRERVGKWSRKILTAGEGWSWLGVWFDNPPQEISRLKELP